MAGIAVGPDNTVVVADSSNHRVQIFDELGQNRSIWIYLGNPWPAFDWENCLWWYLSTIFDKYLTRFWLGGYGNGEGEFDCLAGVAVNRIGQFIIADRWPTKFSTSFGLWINEVLSRYNHRIQIFDPSGHFLRTFGSQVGFVETKIMQNTCLNDKTIPGKW